MSVASDFDQSAIRSAFSTMVVDAEVERHHQDQQQRARHQRDGEGAPAAEPGLGVQQERPGGDGDHGGPGRREQERPHDPEAAGDQDTEGEELERGTRDVQTAPFG